jgi:hypothetical protein
MFVSGDNGGCYFGPSQELAVILGDEVDGHPAGDVAGPVGVLFGQPNPAYGRVPCGDFAAEQADPPAAHDRQPYLLRVPAPHVFSPDSSFG